MQDKYWKPNLFWSGSDPQPTDGSGILYFHLSEFWLRSLKENEKQPDLWEKKSDPLARAQGCESGYLAESAALSQTFFMRLHLHVNSLVECPFNNLQMAVLKRGNNVRLTLDSAWHGAGTSRCSQMRFSLHINMVMLHLDIPPYLVIPGMVEPVVQPEHVHSITPETPQKTVVRYICCRRIRGYVQEGQMEKCTVPKNLNMHLWRKDKKATTDVGRVSLQLIWWHYNQISIRYECLQIHLDSKKD